MRTPFNHLYLNYRSNTLYKPNSEEEEEFLEVDTPRFASITGGEGSGKTTVGVIKALERLRNGCTGALVAQSLGRLQKAVWPQFVQWCDLRMVLGRDRSRLDPGWYPGGAFSIHFEGVHQKSSALYVCAPSDPMQVSGLNLNFVYFDDADLDNINLFKTLDGSLRITGPDGSLPQFWFSLEDLPRTLPKGSPIRWEELSKLELAR